MTNRELPSSKQMTKLEANSNDRRFDAGLPFGRFEFRISNFGFPIASRTALGLKLLAFAHSSAQAIGRFGFPAATFRLSICTALLISAVSAFAIGGVDTPPPPAAPAQPHFPQPQETKLDNGLRVIVAQRPGLPLVAAHVVIGTGSEADAPGLAGTASLTGTLLSKGTETRSAPQIAEEIESLGGDISSGAGWDASTATLVIMSDKVETGLTILADVVLHPTFKGEEIERVRKQRLDGLRVAMQQPGSVSGYVAERVVFGAGAYGHPAAGTIESIGKMRRDDIVGFYKAHYAPANAALVLVGDISLDQGKAYAQKFFGEWNSAAEPQSNSPAGSDWKPRNVVIDMPQAGQASVGVAKPAIKRDSPDYYAGLVANAALGNGFVSRLNREIRIKRGLSYGAHSSLDVRRDIGPFTASAQTKNESAAEVAKLLVGEIKRLVDEPVQGEELKSRQAVLTGSYARSLETNEGIADKLGMLAAFGLPLEKIQQFIPKVNAVTTEEVTAFAKKYLGSPSLIVAGKAPAFLDALKKDFGDVTVIPQNDLDLNSPELVKKPGRDGSP
ncbi:MAG: M16 family metallopeptidase [Chthoniobacterales bacterium]